MGAIEDTRKVLQDFLTPEIREIKARLDSLEKRMDDRFNAVDKRMDDRFNAVDKRMDERFDAVERLAHQRHDAIMFAIGNLANYNEVKDRLSKLEASKEAIHQ